MNLSPIGRACLIAREGRRLTAYRDSVGVWTIGIGHTGAAGGLKPGPGVAITSAECDALFAVDVERYVASVAKGVKVPLSANQADALISVSYNIGPGAFAGSTFLKRLNAGDTAGARDAILNWRIPASILTRRQAEAEQFVTPYATAMPRPTTTQKPVVVSGAPLAPSTVTPAGPIPKTAQHAPVIEPVHLPPAHPWLDALGGWIDRVFAPSSGGFGSTDLAARG